MYSLLISALADNLANLIIYPLSLSTDQVYLLFTIMYLSHLCHFLGVTCEPFGLVYLLCSS